MGLPWASENLYKFCEAQQAHIRSSSQNFRPEEVNEVDLCEINYLGSLLIDFCISTGKHSWLSPKRTPQAGFSHGKG